MQVVTGGDGESISPSVVTTLNQTWTLSGVTESHLYSGLVSRLQQRCTMAKWPMGARQPLHYSATGETGPAEAVTTSSDRSVVVDLSRPVVHKNRVGESCQPRKPSPRRITHVCGGWSRSCLVSSWCPCQNLARCPAPSGGARTGSPARQGAPSLSSGQAKLRGRTAHAGTQHSHAGRTRDRGEAAAIPARTRIDVRY